MSDKAPMWLTRSEDVVAHLYFAAAEIGSAIMEIGSLKIPGSLSFPNAESCTFSFFSHGEVDLKATAVTPGSVVRFDYNQGESTYSFISEVSDISDQQTRRRWRIRFPKAIERNERRLFRRHRVFARPGFQVNTSRVKDRAPLALFDIAAAGLSFVVSARHNLKIGESFSATIHIPGCAPIAAHLDLRNLRPMPGDKSKKLAGCRFSDLSGEDLQSLTTALAQLG